MIDQLEKQIQVHFEQTDDIISSDDVHMHARNAALVARAILSLAEAVREKGNGK